MSRPLVVIVSPALADANNGNWRTARRWADLIAPTHATRITREWPDAAAQSDGWMLALHARRSAPAIAAWASAQAAIAGAERRACSASMRRSPGASASGHCVVIRTGSGASSCAQRRAVRQLPLLASASAGLTMTTDGERDISGL